MATSPSAAEAFYHQLFEKPNPVEFVRSLVTAQVAEEDSLEFKGGKDLTRMEKYWSKALSGFANAGGGVLIWGIDARRDRATGVDRAVAFDHVRDPAAVRTRLTDLLQHATDPPVIGVAVKELLDPTQPGEGFVVCLVPESSFKPHRARRCEGEPYYIRISNRFDILPHSLLRHVFYPQVHARFRFGVQLSFLATPYGRATLKLEGALTNIGNRTAKDVIIQMQTVPGLDLRPVFPFRNLDVTLRPWVDFDASRPIHPGRLDRMFFAELETGTRRSEGGAGDRTIPDLDELTFIARVYAADEERQLCVIHFDADDIQDQQTKVATADLGGGTND